MTRELLSSSRKNNKAINQQNLHSPHTLLGKPCWTSICIQNCLNFPWHKFIRCWKHSSNIDVISSCSCWEFVSCTTMSLIFRKYFIQLRSGMFFGYSEMREKKEKLEISLRCFKGCTMVCYSVGNSHQNMGTWGLTWTWPATILIALAHKGPKCSRVMSPTPSTVWMIDTRDEAMVFWSPVVQFWWVVTNCSFSFLCLDRRGTWCGPFGIKVWHVMYSEMLF